MLWAGVAGMTCLLETPLSRVPGTIVQKSGERFASLVEGSIIAKGSQRNNFDKILLLTSARISRPIQCVLAFDSVARDLTIPPYNIYIISIKHVRYRDTSQSISHSNYLSIFRICSTSASSSSVHPLPSHVLQSPRSSPFNSILFYP